MTLGTITDVTVHTGSRWLPGMDVHIADGRVTAISAHGELPSRGEVLDGRGGHLTPGLVNTHTHLFQTGLRGIGEGLGLLAWLSAVGEEAVLLTPERAYAAAAAAAAEALRSGTTTLVEHMWPHPSPEVHDAVLRALKDSGVRAVLCRGVADRADRSRKWGFDPRLMQPLKEALAHTDELISQARGSRVNVGVAVPNPRCLTPEGMGAVRTYAEERGLPVSLHLLETTTDDTMCRDRTGVGAVEYLERAGFLWERLLAVHCVELDAEGRATLARHGVGVSYNPLSNMRLGSGIAPVPEMLEAGLSVGLGVDGAASNDTQDILEALRIGAYLQRAAHRKADLFGFPEMFTMAVGGANRVLGIEENQDGGVWVGMRADLVLHRFDRDYACLPVRDPGATLLTCAGSRTVASVLVGGEVLVRDGEHVRLSSRELAAGLARWSPCGD
ncbi:amidohydrolase family protein [Streptomyces rubradiris]|uniref:Amidohydrolase n=1 Tax=Streptomyces rubradiris TaxID=285531 RepID=A0ABQ3RAQ7_STRRR|nr:amidohydrolase family protein [Streptomyces rubradiris]GHH18659.1 amidohydrolase [Streptomyces rubradiris]GHI52929.1 amidohydrolase [Streptomyces rubradiris]